MADNEQDDSGIAKVFGAMSLAEVVGECLEIAMHHGSWLTRDHRLPAPTG